MSILEQFDFWKFLAGLGIFLFGMYLIEFGLKQLTGRKFKKFLRQHTTNPVKGILAGTAVTAFLQSSSLVSLMVLAFVGAGIIQLKNAIGIIFGSNLGTTFTGWVVGSLGFQLNIESFSLPLIAIGGLSLISFSKVESFKDFSKLLLGFGFLFLGLDYMKLSIGDFATNFDTSILKGWNPFLFFPVGFVLTAIIQSSSAAMVITLSGLNAGIFPIESAAAMVIGSDLGTTITVILGAFNGGTSKKRVALSHFLFNLITDLLALALLYPLLNFIVNILGIKNITYILVSFHSVFNLLGIVILTPFIGLFSRFLENKFKNDHEHLAKYLVSVSTTVPEAAIEALKKEITGLIDQIFYFNIKSLKIDLGLFAFPKSIQKEESSLFKSQTHQEEYASIKQLEGEIVAYYLRVQNEELHGEESSLLNRYIHAVRNAMIAAKEIKDLKHNIIDFENSSNDTKRSLYGFLKGRLNEFYLSLHQVFNSSKDAAFFEQLADLIQENQKIYERFLKEIYQQIPKNILSEVEISTLLNVNREVHHSNRTLLLAIKDVLLNKEEADNFNTIPELR